MNINEIISRAKNILLKPKDEWKVIATETPEPKSLLLNYALPLALVPTIATFLGLVLFSRYIGIGWAVSSALVVLVSTLVTVYVCAFIIDALAPSFKSEKNFGRSLQLVIYSYTAVWVAGVLNIIPVLGVLSSIAGLYGIYLLYLGLADMKKTPEDNRIGYLVVSALVIIVVMVVIMMILTAIFGAIFFAGGYRAGFFR